MWSGRVTTRPGRCGDAGTGRVNEAGASVDTKRTTDLLFTSSHLSVKGWLTMRSGLLSHSGPYRRGADCFNLTDRDEVRHAGRDVDD